MLRSATEIVWDYHMTVLDDKHKNNDKVPKEWQKDSISIFQHGIVSHLFGFTTEDSVEQEKEGEPLPNAFPLL
jgi:hypothetical protein